VIEVSDEFMIATVDGEIVAHARWSWYRAADGNGAWIVSTYTALVFSRNQAITALAHAGRLAAGYGDDDPFVVSWRKELLL
jgi:hypothetical protein